MHNPKSLAFIILFFSACAIPIAAQNPLPTNVPMTFPGPAPILEVMINGKGPFNFTIDTGAQMQASVDSAIVSQLNLKPNGQVRGGDPLGRNPIVWLKTLREFSLTFDQKNRRVKLERTLTSPAPGTVAVTSGSDGKDYSGRYGERIITAENDALYLQREGGPKLKLISVAKDEFALAEVPEARLKFVRDESGNIKELRVLNRSGEWKVSKRQ